MALQPLSTSYSTFSLLREAGCIYVDKTGYLLSMLNNRQTRVFLSRPRRFGKSLTLSTLEAMFKGQAELFKGLAAEDWVKEQSKHKSPVISITMPRLPTVGALSLRLFRDLKNIARTFSIDIEPMDVSELSTYFKYLIQALAERDEPVVVLIDEYDRPILDRINDRQEAENARSFLQSFYSELKDSDRYIRFLMLTGVSKFSKLGLFSGMNNLEDISMDGEYATLCGYTQEELESYFSDRLDILAKKENCSLSEILRKLKAQYDGFSFDGIHQVYAPWSVLNCLQKNNLKDYWFESASTTFLAQYLKEHHIPEPGNFHNITVQEDFMSSYEIENAPPASLLYQAGYLTIRKISDDGEITLDYPNNEVIRSMSRLYITDIYGLQNGVSLGKQMRRALENGDIAAAVEAFNKILTAIPYRDFAVLREAIYRSLLVTTLHASGLSCQTESQTSSGQSDLIVHFATRIYVFELKVAHKGESPDTLLQTAKNQIHEKHYSSSQENDTRPVVGVALVIDNETHAVVRCETV